MKMMVLNLWFMVKTLAKREGGGTSMTKQESVSCKECDETFTQYDEIIVFDGIAWHKDCLDKFPAIYAYYEKGKDGEFLNTGEHADFEGDAYEHFDGLEEE